MNYPFQSSSALLRGPMFLVALCGFAATPAYSAGAAAATSSYLTIQPNAANTGYVYTFSWVAPDTDNDASGTTYTDTRFTQPFGNGTGRIDDVNTGIAGGNYTAPGGQAVRYAWGMSAANNDFAPANTETIVQWQNPMDYTVGVTGPSVANPRFDSIGDWTNMETYVVGSGIQSVTGVFSTNPNGTGAATGTGVGFAVDTDGATGLLAASDDFSPHLTGYSHILDATPTNPYPNTGYVRVEVPYPTGGPDFTTRFNSGTYTENAAVEVFVTTSPEGTYNAKIAVSGDLDSDLDVDAADLTAAAAGFGGAGVTGKWYATGDMNADGDNDNADLGFIIGDFTPRTPSGSATLTYDPLTGNVKLNATTAGGAKITSFQLQNGAGTFVPGSYAGPAFGGTYQNVTVNVIGNSDTTLTGATGQVDLGNVFPLGMDLAGLQAYLTTAVYTGSSGTGQQQLNLALAVGGGPTYASWSGGAAADGDANDDGVKNAVAWALGAADTSENAIGLLPTLDNTSDPDFFIFNFNRSDDANADDSTTITVEYGSTLSNDWTTAVAGVDVVITETPGSPTDAVEVKIRRTLAVGDKLFARIKVEVTP